MAYAGFWRRFIAALIDLFLMLLVTWAVLRVVVELGWELTPPKMFVDEFNIYRQIETGPLSPFWLPLAIVVAMDWLYRSIMQSSALQATVGKIIMNIYVTDLMGQRIVFGRATVRYIASYASALILLMGYLIMPFTARRQTLHDMVAGTLVVYEFAQPADIR